MSENIYDDNGLMITSFFGGKERGRCLQITLSGTAADEGYVQKTSGEVYHLISVLKGWTGTKYSTREIAEEISDLINLLSAHNLIHDVIHEDYDSNLIRKIDRLKQMHQYLYDIKEGI